MNNQMIFVRIATINDIRYVNEIIKGTAASAITRGTGIGKRTPESVAQKIRDGKAVIALTSAGKWVGFSYFEAWEEGNFVSNSGLIVAPELICSILFFHILQMIPHWTCRLMNHNINKTSVMQFSVRIIKNDHESH